MVVEIHQVVVPDMLLLLTSRKLMEHGLLLSKMVTVAKNLHILLGQRTH